MMAWFRTVAIDSAVTCGFDSSMRELYASVFAGGRQHIVRPIHRSDGCSFHDHKGFNWIVLRDMLGERCVVEKTLASPVTRFSPQFGT